VSLYHLCDLQDGLVLVTGPTGSGKTSTLAALIDRINATKPCHIMTIEDPVEYVFNHKQALVNQRELYTDVPSFAEGLRSALREDPDVILVGEMRDLETIRTAIMAAETGHLVLATLHTRDATATIGRIVGVYPTDEQEQIAHQLSLALRAVVSQKLIRRKDGSGRVPAVEIMMVTPGISNMIRQHKTEQIRTVIETGATQGMQSMENAFVRLYREGKIDRQTVLRNARDVNFVERMMK
jgi:twitching motility protein PilT